MMSEGRKIRVVLLSDKYLDMLVQPKLLASELMEMTASHLMLKERDYFGLCYKEDAGYYQWLSLDRRVLDHDLPKNQKPVLLFFQVRLYVESICQLKDPATIELFYLNARQAIAQERLRCDSATMFELAAYVLQEAHGDYTEDTAACCALKALPLIPVGTLKEHPSISFCEEQILLKYRQLTGMTRGFSIVNYMKIVENLPSYGIHFYEVKDKAGLPWWLGLSVKGITVYDFKDRLFPRREFLWKRLVNLYYRDRKFSIQIHDAKIDIDSGSRSGSLSGANRSRRPFTQNQVTNVHSWFSSSSQLTKTIWSMAVCQHKKYVDLRTKSSIKSGITSTVRSLIEVASDLTNNSTSQTSNASDCSSLSAGSHSSASNSKAELNEDLQSETYRAAMMEMYNALKERKEFLENQLKKKTKQLCQLCFQEAEMTGFMPPETPIASGELIPKFRRRVGTSFTLSPKVLEKHNRHSDKGGYKNDPDDCDQLEMDFEIQDKITQAALMLATDKSVRRSVRKKRALSYQRASQKLKDMEAKLLDVRLQSASRKDSLTTQSNFSDGHVSEDSRDILDSETEFTSPFNSPLISRHEMNIDRLQMPATPMSEKKLDINEADRKREDEEEVDDKEAGTNGAYRSASRVMQSSSAQSFPQPLLQSPLSETVQSSPCSPVMDTSQRHIMSHEISPSPAPSPTVSRQRLGGYIPSSIYSTRTQYRSQRYPTLCGTYATQPVDEEGEPLPPNDNVYNVWSHKTAFYDSGDELKTPSPAAPQAEFCTSPKEVMVFVATPKSSQLSDVLDSSLAPGADNNVALRAVAQPLSTPEGLMKMQCSVMPPTNVIPGNVIRSTCHVVTSVNRSCKVYGDGSKHVVQNVKTETARVYEARSPSAGGMDQSSPVSPCQASSYETTVQKYHNYIEISKPFEMSDFYKYSERLRRQRLVGQVTSFGSTQVPLSAQELVRPDGSVTENH